MRAAVTDARLARHFAWTGVANSSTSIEQVSGTAVRTNYIRDPKLATPIYWITSNITADFSTPGEVTIAPTGKSSDSYLQYGGYANNMGLVAGHTYTFAANITVASALPVAISPLAFFWRSKSVYSSVNSGTIQPTAGTSGRFQVTCTLPAGMDQAFVRTYLRSSSGSITMDHPIVVEGTNVSWFCGDTVIDAANINDPIRG